MPAQKLTEELEFALDLSSGVPYYRQIIKQVEMAIVDGRLRKGTRLPTVRSLAVSLQVNPNTVVRAYNELEIRGIVNTQQGSGTFISGKTIELNEQERDDVLKNLLDSFLANASSYGFSIDEITRSLMRRKGELKL